MNDLIIALIGVALGTYFAEPIRDTIPVLDPQGKTDDKPTV